MGMPEKKMAIALVLRTLEDTGKLGKKLGRISKPGDAILLHGPLGAGKTTLVQSIAQGLAVPPECYVTSPSFALLHEYPGRIPLYHIDCYRLENEDDVEQSGLIDYIVADGLTVIEWPDRLGEMVPAERLDIEIDPVAADARKVMLTAHGKDWRERLDSIAACLNRDINQDRIQ